METGRATTTASNGDASTAAKAHRDIDDTLRSRRAPHGTAREKVESGLKDVAGVAWATMKRHPFLGVAIAGGAGVAAATAIGVGELAVGLAIGFAAYKVLREGEPPLEALEDMEKEIR